VGLFERKLVAGFTGCEITKYIRIGGIFDNPTIIRNFANRYGGA
jgi:hypothetical protein